MDGALKATPRAFGSVERVANDNGSERDRCESRARFWALAKTRTSNPAAEERWKRDESKRAARGAL
jgi:hypothetical protein